MELEIEDKKLRKIMKKTKKKEDKMLQKITIIQN